MDKLMQETIKVIECGGITVKQANELLEFAQLQGLDAFIERKEGKATIVVQPMVVE